MDADEQAVMDEQWRQAARERQRAQPSLIRGSKVSARADEWLRLALQPLQPDDYPASDSG
jgi:hypothetical protein